MKRVGVVLHRERPEAAATAGWLAERLAARGVEVYALDADAARAKTSQVIPVSELPDDLDLLFVLGGDGTLLRAGELAGRHGVPLLGVNFGHLGFLSELERGELDAALDRLLGEGFEIEERMVLEGEIVESARSRSIWALNDVIVGKERVGRAVKLALDIGGEPFVTWASDGVIVATATGSTAYSFSAGGPVVSPRLDCMIVTPVSPHALFHASVVVAPDESLTIRVLHDADAVSLSADGGIALPLSSGAEVHLRAAKARLRLAKLEPAPFWRLVREKFRLPAEPQ